uniref:CUB domain-containing protein n=1 Tax=Rhabditophanes sp. KR3021 TaxID=114890 RepID=A0AC35TMS2_9BILA
MGGKNEIILEQSNLFLSEGYTTVALAANTNIYKLCAVRKLDNSEKVVSVVEFWNVLEMPTMVLEKCIPFNNVEFEACAWVGDFAIITSDNGSIYQLSPFNQIVSKIYICPSPLWCIAVMSGSKFVVGSDNGAIYYCNLNKEKGNKAEMSSRTNIDMATRVLSIAYCPELSTLALGLLDNVHFIKLQNEHEHKTFSVRLPKRNSNAEVLIWSLSFMGKALAAGDSLGKVTLLNGKNGALIKQIPSHQGDVLCMSVEGMTIFAAGVDYRIQIISALTSQDKKFDYATKGQRIIHTNDVKAMTSVHDWLISGGAEHDLVLSKKHVKTVRYGPGNGTIMSAQSNKLLMVHSNFVEVWEKGDSTFDEKKKVGDSYECTKIPKNLMRLGSIKGRYITNGAISPNGRVIATTTDKCLLICKFDYGSEKLSMEKIGTVDENVSALKIFDDYIICCSGNFKIFKFDFETKETTVIAETENNTDILKFECSGDKKLLVALNSRNQLLVFGKEDSEDIFETINVPSPVTGFQFISNDTIVVSTVSNEESLTLYNVATSNPKNKSLSQKAIFGKEEMDYIRNVSFNHALDKLIVSTGSKWKIISGLGQGKAILESDDTIQKSLNTPFSDSVFLPYWINCGLKESNIILTHASPREAPSNVAKNISRYGLGLFCESALGQCEVPIYIESSNASSGFLHSPNYPTSYPEDQNCQYILIGTPDLVIHLTFIDFDLEDSFAISQQCLNDYVLIIVTDRNGRRHYGERYCGNKLPSPIKTMQYKAEIMFTSSRMGHKRGFKIRYDFIGEAECEKASLYLSDGYKHDGLSEIGNKKFMSQQLEVKFCGNELYYAEEGMMSYLSQGNRVIIKFVTKEKPSVEQFNKYESEGKPIGFKLRWTEVLSLVEEGDNERRCEGFTCSGGEFCIDDGQNGHTSLRILLEILIILWRYNPLVPEQKEYRLHVMAGTIYLYFHFYMGNGKVNLQIVKENLYLFLGVSEREFTKKVGFNLYDFINLDICKSYFETLTGENGELYITISNNNETECLKIAAAAIKLGFNNSKSVNKETSKYLAIDKGLKKVVGMKDQASTINTDYNCKDEEFYDYDQIQSKVTANRVQEVEQCNYEDNLFCESNKFNQFLDGNYDQMPGEKEIRNTLNRSKLSKKRGQYIYKNSCKSLVLDGFDVVQTTLGKMVMYYIILLGPQYYCSETALFHNVPLYLYHFEENIKLFTGFNFDFEFCQKYFGLNTLKDVFMKYFSKEIKIEWNANNKFLLVICDRRVIQKNFDTAKKKFAELTNVNEFKESSVRQDVEDAKVFATATNWIPYGMTAENLFIKNNYHKE